MGLYLDPIVMKRCFDGDDKGLDLLRHNSLLRQP